MSDISVVLEMLLDKTEAGKIVWRVSPVRDGFTASVGSQLVTVARLAHSSYSLRVLDESGSRVVSVESGRQTPDTRAMMEKLFETVQKSRIDTGIAALITELQKI